MWGKKTKEDPDSGPLEDPGIPIVLTLKIDADGHMDIRYKGEPSWAVESLRDLATKIAVETGLESPQEP